MNQMKISTVVIAGFLICNLQSGCRSLDRASSGANSAREISRLQLDIDKALQSQYDVLAPKELAKAQSYLDQAREERLRYERSARLWDELGQARAWLNRATTLYKERRATAQPSLRARQDALNAGARIWARSNHELRALDSSFRANASTIGHNPKAQERLVADYRGVEVIAVQEEQVGGARGRIAQARDLGAEIYAPQALSQAENSLRVAQAAITRNPRQKALYVDHVAYANQAARNLITLNALARNASGLTNEQIAREITLRDREVANLHSELRGSELEANIKDRALIATSTELEAANQRLETHAKMEQALNDVRNKFTRDEADVYRDGDRLLIQLKKMDFKSGSAALPGGAAPLLTKVKAVLRDVHAKDVVVQGHADATGTPRINQKIAKARAETVKGFIKNQTGFAKVSSEGLSESRPIRSNKTPEGRATNRRVDLLITPSLPRAQE